MRLFMMISLFAIALLQGCRERQSLHPAEYVEWIENPGNGLRTTKQVDELLFTLQYKPHDYLALKASKKINPTAEEMRKYKNEISDLQYFTLQLGNADSTADGLTTGMNDDSEFYGRIQYFTSAIQNDFKLVDGKDTLPCVLHHFERTYGLTPYTSFVLGFRNSQKNEVTDKIFIYEDKILQTGTIKISIDAASLERIPQLITQ